MASISSLGIGSGIDTAAMLEQIKLGEQSRLTPYTSLQSSYKSKVSAWGLISNSMSALQTNVGKLNGEAFNTLTVSTNTSFSATATSDARADTHAVTVHQLATAHKIKTDAYESQDERLGENTGGTRTMTISQKDGSEMEVELADDETSLAQIAKAINRENGDVTASVQRTDDGYQLVLSSKTTGTDGEISVNVEGDDTLAGVLNTTGGGDTGEDDSPGTGMKVVSAATDAKLTVDGSNYTRSSNTITDILDGVTLTLKAVTEAGEPEQLTLNKDNSAIESSVQEFVTQYNSLMGLTSSSSKYVPYDSSSLSNNELATTNSENGALMGDATLRGMVGELRSAVNGVYGNSDSTYRSLADIGIKIDASTGQMTLDEDKLKQAIADDADGIAFMFMGTEENPGLAATLDGIITKYVGDSENKVDGIIKNSTDSLNSQVDILQTQIDKTQRLIDASVERYRVQFQQLDSTMAQLNSMSAQLSALLLTL
ncbi:flagellar cap protein [Citrobacter amalonaticus]|uniref:Flagellar hook-associated protein 2 n=1 Tax=Citrobacter amalonaticus TaxID=35703 RepID=A0A2S4RPT3_CITAM|nr:flagellar filament capping protein FliD [Citrobacter amalonaticus]POT54761.1 flagellar cap protein [Citrobacter amalonaticus]POT68933.1 flagellar cap protein [Citrobacter amalonaticus]POU59071.1 flagellar cap protein [Citrobacter amalonaticus]POV02305.1 flagellar cap protein [Citrobacter amalonaticus]